MKDEWGNVLGLNHTARCYSAPQTTRFPLTLFSKTWPPFGAMCDTGALNAGISIWTKWFWVQSPGHIIFLDCPLQLRLAQLAVKSNDSWDCACLVQIIAGLVCRTLAPSLVLQVGWHGEVPIELHIWPPRGSKTFITPSSKWPPNPHTLLPTFGAEGFYRLAYFVFVFNVHFLLFPGRFIWEVWCHFVNCFNRKHTRNNERNVFDSSFWNLCAFMRC